MKRGLPMVLLFLVLSFGAFAQLTAPFTESFPTTSIPSGWSSFNDCASTSTNAFFKYGGTLGYDGSICTDHTGSSGSTYAWVDGSSPAPCRVTLQTDSIDVSNLTGLYLEFYLFSYNSSYAAYGYNTVVINFFDGTNWNDSVMVYSGSDINWQYKGIDLSTYSVSGKVMFQFVVDKNALTPYYNDIAFDDIAVKNPPSCPFPNGFMVNSVDTTSATLSWGAVGSAGSYKVIYGAPGFNPNTTGTLDSSSVDSIVLTGLNPSTNYEAYLYADCGGGDYSDTVGPVSFATLCYPVVGGTYTINSSLPTGGTNFASFADFSYAVTCGGITGPVVANVAPFSGPYQEQAYFGSIPGASSTNTITINGNGETLEHDGTGSQYTMGMEGATYVEVNNLVIKATGTSQGWGVWIGGGSEYITIDSCTVSVDQTSTSFNLEAFVVSPSSSSPTTSGLGGQNLTITNNTMEGGYYCMTLMGPSTGTMALNNVVENNVIRDFVYYGIYTRNQQNASIKGNDISRPNRSTAYSFYGIYGSGNFFDTEITGNALHNMYDQNPTYTGTVYAIYLSGATGGGGVGPLVISNNLIYNVNMDGTQYGIYLSGTTDSILVYHNTISLDNVNATGTSSTRGIYITSSSSTTDVEVMNNVISITRGGAGSKHGIYTSSSTPNYTIDYNQYFVNSAGGGNNAGLFGGTSYTNVSDIQANTNFEANGVQGDPLFVNSMGGDLTPTSGAGDNNAAALSTIVPVDFYAVVRPVSGADRGAIEFAKLTCLQPYNVIHDSVTTSSVYVQWTNDQDADSVKVEWVPCGGTQGTGNYAFVTDSSYTITGLTDNTCYDIYLITYCSGSQGNGNALISGVNTKCLPVSIPYVEPFTNWVPSCVELSPGGGGGWLWSQYTNTTGEYAEASFWTYSTGWSTMKMADVNLSSRAWVRFKWAHQYNAFWAGDRLVVRAAEVGTSTWDTLMDITGPDFDSPNANSSSPPSDPNDFIEEQFILDASTVGKVYTFELIAVTGWGPDLFIDEFVVEPVPPCLPPYDISLVSLGADSATVGWQTVQGTGFNIEYGPCGFTQGSGVGTVINNVTSPYTIKNLTPNTCYDVYVNDTCSTVWAGPFSFKTDCLAQLNGVYTVGGSPAPNNFATLDSALAELNGCGISGPVVFDIAPGKYNTSINLLPILGSSTTNTVTFKGASAAQDTIDGSGQVAAAQIRGASNLIFKNLTITNPLSGWGVWFSNGANNITIDSCNIVTSQTSTSSLDNVIVASSSTTSPFGYGLNASNVTISNCKIVGGYYGMTINGQSSTSRIHGWTISNNEFTGQYFYGTFFYYVDTVNFHDNIMDGTRSTGGYGLYLYYTNHIDVQRNYLNTGTYALYSSQLNLSQTQTERSKIVNNIFKGGTYGMYMSSADSVDFHHNTISGGTRGMYLVGTHNGHDIRNNIIVSRGTLEAFYYSALAPLSSMDYNLYYAPNASNVGRNGSTSYADLAAWQTGQPNLNMNSLEGDPVFAGPDDFHIIGTLPNDTGDNSVGVVVDFDGDVRPASGSTKVDIGADEFTPKQWDAEFIALLGANGGCGDSTVALNVVVRNLGQQPITSLPVGVNITGSLTTTLNNTASVNIPSLGVDTVFAGTFNAYSGGVFNFHAGLALANDQEIANDSGQVMNKVYIPYEPIVFSGDSVCSGVDSVDLAALPIPGAMYGWFANLTDTVALAEGDTFKVSVTGQNTYYVEYLSNADSLLTTFQAGNGQNGNMFDIVVKNSVTLTGLTVSPQASGTETFEVYYRPGAFSGFENSSAGWTLIETHTSSNVTAGGYYFPLTSPLSLSNGTHALYVTSATGSVNYTTGTNPGGIYASNNDIDFLEGVGKSYPFGSTFNPRIWNGILHYGSVGCSQIRVPVSFGIDSSVVSASGTATPTGTGSLTVNFDATATTGGDVYTWKFGDGNTGWGDTISHTYGQGGDYTVWLIATDTVCGTVDSVMIPLNGLNVDESVLNRSLNIYPNPTQGVVTVSFDVNGTQTVQVRILNILGQELTAFHYGQVSGEFKQSYDLDGQPDGVYLIEIRTDQGVTTQRINLHR